MQPHLRCRTTRVPNMSLSCNNALCALSPIERLDSSRARLCTTSAPCPFFSKPCPNHPLDWKALSAISDIPLFSTSGLHFMRDHHSPTQGCTSYFRPFIICFAQSASVKRELCSAVTWSGHMYCMHSHALSDWQTPAGPPLQLRHCWGGKRDAL